MPYVPGAVCHSVVHVSDVFHSANVFANFVPIALWMKPLPNGAIALSELTLTPLSYEQIDALSTSTGLAAVDPLAAEVGLSNKGEVPQEGPITYTSLNSEIAQGSTATFSSSTVIITTGTGVFIELAKNIDLCLNEAKQGLWKENGKNPRILACYDAVGIAQASDSVPWCAAFAGALMKKVGARAIRTLSSLAYKGYGEAVPIGDPTKYRLNDVVVFSRSGGGHIGFFRGYNPSNGSLLIAGGNQSDNLTEVGFRSNGMPVVYVGRAWEIPKEYDVPVTYSGGGGSVKVV